MCYSYFWQAITLTEKKSASAVFKIDQMDNSNGFNLNDELGTLAALAGFSGVEGATSGIDLLLERAQGREFIIDMNTMLSIDKDVYFNKYNPDHKDPFWKATIKNIIGWQKTEIEKNAIIENNILKNYRKNVLFKKTEGGAIKISVTHTDPQIASLYANNFMQEIRKMVEQESETSQKLRLAYLSETLADALQDMDKAQENLKNYALENSAMAQENFISDSLNLIKFVWKNEKLKKLPICFIL